MAHFKSPLQDVVRAAQAAEKRAKRELGRNAVAVTLLKRSGEIIEWGCQWCSGGLDAYARIVKGLQKDVVSRKFPYRIVELVDGYLADQPNHLGGTKPVADFHRLAPEILDREVAIAAERQRGKSYSAGEVRCIQSAINGYLGNLSSGQEKIRALIGLCQTVAFIERNLDDSSPSPSESSAPSVVSTSQAERQATP